MAINGDVAQAQRERTVNQLKAGKLDILVATDVAARGLDVERISHVVNYDIPTDTESYVHRIGRTGRAGRSGDAISFVTPRERYLLKHIEKATRQPLTQMSLPSVEDINSHPAGPLRRRRSPRRSATRRIGFFRDVVAHYVREHDVPEVDVAAALAVVLQGDKPLLLEPEPERHAPAASEREGPRRRPAGGAPAHGRDAIAGRADAAMATYRISVGKRHKVEPRQIVGAIANEGGLSREDFGAIAIRPGLLPRRAARRPVRRDLGEAARDPDLRQADRDQARQRSATAGAPSAPRAPEGRRSAPRSRGTRRSKPRADASAIAQVADSSLVSAWGWYTSAMRKPSRSRASFAIAGAMAVALWLGGCDAVGGDEGPDPEPTVAALAEALAGGDLSEVAFGEATAAQAGAAYVEIVDGHGRGDPRRRGG